MQSINFLDSQHSLLSFARIGCYGAAAVFAGRKIALAANYKLGSCIAAFFDDNKLAKKLDSVSDHYLKLAKKDLKKDLAIASGFFATGVGLQIAEDPNSFFKIFENVMSPPVNNSEQLSIFGKPKEEPTKGYRIEGNKVTPLKPYEIEPFAEGELYSVKEEWVDGVSKRVPVKIYEGGLVNGTIMHGHGKLVAPDSGIAYEGEFNQGRLQGYGVLRKPDGFVYEGQFENGREHGHGAYKSPDGSYEGEFHQGLKHGHGVLRKSNGFVYEGNFENGREHGYGKYKGSDGSSYEGHFANGKVDGEGKQIFAHGEIYEGLFKQGYRLHGMVKLPDGRIYRGPFENNLPSGYGSITYPDGRVEKGLIGGRYVEPKDKQ